MTYQCVVAQFDDLPSTERAIHELARAGLSDQTSLVTRHIANEIPEEARNAIQVDDISNRTAVEGATLGGVLGALLASPLLLIPGAGPVLIAGPMAAGLTGAMVGGFVGAMSGWSVPAERLNEYQARLDAGASLLVVNGRPDDLAIAKVILDQSGATEVTLHSTTAEVEEL